jgi:ankyrin repeat protein
MLVRTFADACFFAIRNRLPIGFSKRANTVSRIKFYTSLISRLAILALSTVCHAQVDLDVGAGPLHLAAAEGRVEDVKRLIEAGTAVDIRATRSRGTPLHFAARDGRYPVVKLLVELGADVDAKTEYGNTPLHLAARSRLLVCANPFRGDDATGLPAAHLAVVQLLLESGASVDPGNREGVTPLHGAATCNDVGIASLLIAKGANVNNRSNQYSVLDQAIAWGPDVAKLLIESGVEVNTVVPYSGETPLINAVKKGRIELTRMLLEAGADPNALHRRTQWTALDYAIYYCAPELVQILQAHGAKGGGQLGKKGTPRRLEPCPEFPDLDRVPSQRDRQ